MLKKVEPKVGETMVPGHGVLVGIRPVSSDIPKSIAEKRDVKLHQHGLPMIIYEKLGPIKLSLFFFSIGAVLLATFMGHLPWYGGVVGVLLVFVITLLHFFGRI
mmetsp:Transcript_843/g.1415  ORF Transcript_843/g.1415 Transcript_843/m.1415 type:complete len:104 (-) Transcript_843:43-354(-)